jgi:uncharacterized repeat protein (TIGR01451 family)
MALVVLSTVILSACQAPQRDDSSLSAPNNADYMSQNSAPRVPAAVQTSDSGPAPTSNFDGAVIQASATLPRTLPGNAHSGDAPMPGGMYEQGAVAGEGYCGPGGCVNPAFAPHGQWRPPGIGGTWPRDEYVRDGGDELPHARVSRDWRVHGLAPEETIVHFDTVDGETDSCASNPVCIYAPRFSAVRHVTSFTQYEAIDAIGRNRGATGAIRFDGRDVPSTALQPEQPVVNSAVNPTTVVEAEHPHATLGSSLEAIEVAGDLKAYEDFSIVRWGRLDQTERVRLAESIESAIAWTGDLTAQVTVGTKQAAIVTLDKGAEQTIGVDSPTGDCVRVVKLASKKEAKPGEIVEFTIRFDNIGARDIGNVTIVDNLTTRLEYVDKSAESTLKAEFFAEPNEVGSLVLRWELADPMPVGKGGVVRFKAKVR